MIAPDAVPVRRVRWRGARRIIRSRHPPVDLFEDIADPADWPLLIAAEQKTNPRLMEQLGALDLVPPARRVGGAGASWLMAPFRQPLRSLSRQTQAEMTRLIHRGRIEEAISRVMTTELTDEMVSVLLAYLGDKPEVRRLIREQGMSMGEEIVDEVRNQSASVDARVESIVRRLLNRTPRPPSPPPISAT